jgi:DNA uptake protein ComE-like DNA-binding protein
VASILALAARISQQAQTAIQGLEQVRINTASLAGVDQTNASGLAILKACQTARGALGG